MSILFWVGLFFAMPIILALAGLALSLIIILLAIPVWIALAILNFVEDAMYG
jgi:hypothetical protein